MAKKIRIDNKNNSIDNDNKKKSNYFFIVLFIISLVCNILLVILTIYMNHEYKASENNLEQVSEARRKLESDMLYIKGDKTKDYIKNKLNFIDDNVVFQIEGFGNYYYTYDCMMDRVNGEYSYWAYNKEAAIGKGLRRGDC